MIMVQGAWDRKKSSEMMEGAPCFCFEVLSFSQRQRAVTHSSTKNTGGGSLTAVKYINRHIHACALPMHGYLEEPLGLRSLLAPCCPSWGGLCSSQSSMHHVSRQSRPPPVISLSPCRAPSLTVTILLPLTHTLMRAQQRQESRHCGWGKEVNLVSKLGLDMTAAE